MSTIIELQVENVKRIRAVQVFPKGSTTVISGKNDQGKTSVLDSIDYAFRGEKSICEEPLRHGEKRGLVRVKLSEELNSVCTIERRFTPGGTVLEIKNADGVQQKSPQALLDAIISKVTFDPLSFVRMKPAEQLEQLRKLVGLDFTEVNSVRKLAFDERTLRNRELEAAKTKALAHPFNPAAPKEEITANDLIEQLAVAKNKNNANEQKKQEYTRAITDLDTAMAWKRQLEAEIEAMEKALATKREHLSQQVEQCAKATLLKENLKKEVETLVAADESTALKAIADIHATNQLVAANRLHKAAQDDVELLTGTVAALTAKIKECDDDKAAQIEFAQFPMPGLSFEEARGVLLNGAPFQQGSGARQLQASVAIGLALNPKVRVILIRDGSLLDDESMALVKDMAAQAKAQIWVEVVNSKDPCAIVIEDGGVK